MLMVASLHHAQQHASTGTCKVNCKPGRCKLLLGQSSWLLHFHKEACAVSSLYVESAWTLGCIAIRLQSVSCLGLALRERDMSLDAVCASTSHDAHSGAPCF